VHQSQASTVDREIWTKRAKAFLDACIDALWAHDNEGLLYLRNRGFHDEIIRAARMGFNPEDRFNKPCNWGFDARDKRVFLPKGVVLPYFRGGVLAALQIRRLGQNIKGGKYFFVRGSVPCLWGVDALVPNRPVVLVEGVFNALAIRQAAGDLVTPIATGGTSLARDPSSVALLAKAPLVIVAFDADDAGDEAATFWTEALLNARRWRPLWADTNAMLMEDVNVRGWIEAALRPKSSPTTPAETTTAEPEPHAPEPEVSPPLFLRFDEYLRLAEEQGAADAMNATKARDPNLFAHLWSIVEERQARLQQVWAGCQRGEKDEGTALYAMERFYEALISFPGCCRS